MPLGESWQTGKISSPWKLPSPAGRCDRTDRELQRLKRRVQELACGSQGRERLAQMVLVASLPSPRCVPAGVHRGLVLEQASAERLKERTQFGCIDTA